MTTIQFLAEWTVRSSALILCGALLLWALRVKNSAMRLAAWAVMLFGSLAIPMLTPVLPKLPLVVMRAAARPVETPVVINDFTPPPTPRAMRPDGSRADVPRPFDWARVVVAIYALIALALLLRLCAGLAMSLRLLRNSRATDRAVDGIEIRESDGVAAPVALGIVRPAILLPGDWRQWDGAKLDVVLAHERAHIRRFDPAVQLLSAVHRALLWHSPLSWFLHRRIVRVAEEASDDAAVAVTGDRAFYAEVLLGFMQRGVVGTRGLGVPMARYGRPDDRIHRILDGKSLSRGVTRWSVAVILALGSPLAYVAAAAHPQNAPEQSTALVQADTFPVAPIQVAQQQPPAPDALPVKPLDQNLRNLREEMERLENLRNLRAAQNDAAAKSESAPAYLNGLGIVSAYTVTVKPRVDGQLMSISFKEGDVVQAGQLLASIDPRPYELQLAEAEGQMAWDSPGTSNGTHDQVEGRKRLYQAKIDDAKLRLSYTQVRAPISGVAGLRLVDPGNVVHAADTTGIVIITQLQPISVVFTIPEDQLPQVRARIREGASLVVEAWSRDSTVKFAAGRLTAIDNQIDQSDGTVKLKAAFDNKDEALFPNQFVNAKLILK